jgi:hypothetical protein
MRGAAAAPVSEAPQSQRVNLTRHDCAKARRGKVRLIKEGLMGLSTVLHRMLALSTLSIAVLSCGGDGPGHCLVLPCAMPLAMTVRVTNATTGGPVNGATVQVSGATAATIPCNSLCYVPGIAGTYVLDVGAPGFQSRQVTLAVQGTNPECGCPTVVAQVLEIALSPAP